MFIKIALLSVLYRRLKKTQKAKDQTASKCQPLYEYRSVWSTSKPHVFLPYHANVLS